MKETKLEEITQRIGAVIEDYDWAENTDNVGFLIITANLNAYKSECAGRVNVVTQALVNAMIKNPVLRDVVIASHDAFVNFIVDQVEQEKTLN